MYNQDSIVRSIASPTPPGLSAEGIVGYIIPYHHQVDSDTPEQHTSIHLETLYVSYNPGNNPSGMIGSSRLCWRIPSLTQRLPHHIATRHQLHLQHTCTDITLLWKSTQTKHQYTQLVYFLIVSPKLSPLIVADLSGSCLLPIEFLSFRNSKYFL